MWFAKTSRYHYQLYHHVFVFTYTGEWSVIQQGMNANKKTARRYHWFSEAKKEFVVEPHTAVCCDKRDRTLNLVAFESRDARQICTDLSKEKPDKTVKEIKKIQNLELTERHHIIAADEIQKDFTGYWLRHMKASLKTLKDCLVSRV